MYTVVLAGGFGTRLKAVLEDIPKPMAPVDGKPFLEYIVDNLKQNGLKEYIFCLYHMHEKISDFFKDGRDFGVEICYSIESFPMGTGGALGLLKDRLKEAFCVINADTYISMDIQECLQLHKERKSTATIAVTKVPDISRYGEVITDDKGNIISFSEKEACSKKSGYINAGMYILEPEILSFIPENKFVSLEQDVFPALINNGLGIGSFNKTADFFDIGIPKDYYRFQSWIDASKKNS